MRFFVCFFNTALLWQKGKLWWSLWCCLQISFQTVLATFKKNLSQLLGWLLGGQLQLAAPAGMASAAENFLTQGHALMGAAHTNWLMRGVYKCQVILVHPVQSNINRLFLFQSSSVGLVIGRSCHQAKITTQPLLLCPAAFFSPFYKF